MKIDYLRRLTLVLGGLGLTGSLVVAMASVADDQVPVVSGEKIPYNPFERGAERPIERPALKPEVVIESGGAMPVGGSFRPAGATPIQPAAAPRMTRLPATTPAATVAPVVTRPSSTPTVSAVSPVVVSANEANPAHRSGAESRPAVDSAAPAVVSAKPAVAAASDTPAPAVASTNSVVRPAARIERLPAPSSTRPSSAAPAPIVADTMPQVVVKPEVVPVAAESSTSAEMPRPVVVADLQTSSAPSPATSSDASRSQRDAVIAAAPPVTSPAPPTTPSAPSVRRTELKEAVAAVASPSTPEPPKVATESSIVSSVTRLAPTPSAPQPEPVKPTIPTFASTAAAPRIEPTRPVVAPRVEERASLSPVSVRTAGSSENDNFEPRARAIPAILPSGGIDQEVWQETQELIVPDDETIVGEEILDGEMTSVVEDFGYRGDCCQPCPRRRYVIAEGLLFRREGEFTQLSTAFAADGFDYEIGGRATFGVRADCLNGWEASYMTTEPWYTQSSQAGGALFPTFTAGGGLTAANLSSFTGADFQETVYKSHLQSFEYNRLDWGWDVISLGFGLRYLTLEDDLRFTSIKGADRGDLMLEMNNHIFGPQWTGELFYDIGNRAFMSWKGKVGVFANINDGNATFINQGPGATAFTNSDQNVGFAAMGELQANLYYKLTRNTRLRAGYEAWYLYGAATANDQLTSVITPSFGRSINDEDDVFMHGATVGFEWIR